MADTKAKLSAMLEKFGVVTVMDVDFYTTVRHKVSNENYEVGEWDAKSTLEGEPVVHLDTLKITNINAEGPNKTATGGMSNDTLIKYGKTFSMEMQDALGRYGVLTNLYGANASKNEDILAITDKFPGEMTLVGDTFFIDQATGAKQPLKVVVPVFLGNGIFNLTQDAEGDISTFDLNGDVLRFEKETTDTVNANGKYEKGGDNSFYFLCTKDAFTVIKTVGYREAFDGTAQA